MKVKISSTFAAPTEVARVQSHGAKFCVTTANAHRVHTVGADFCIGRGSTRFILPLLFDVCLAATSSSSLMPTVARDTHIFSRTYK